MTTPAGTPATSPRRYGVGDTIVGYGTVAAISDTAYLIEVGGQAVRWLPFYGPNGVDQPAPVVGLVTFADGTRYGGLASPCPQCSAPAGLSCLHPSRRRCPDHFIGTETLRCLTCGATS